MPTVQKTTHEEVAPGLEEHSSVGSRGHRNYRSCDDSARGTTLYNLILAHRVHFKFSRFMLSWVIRSRVVVAPSEVHQPSVPQAQRHLTPLRLLIRARAPPSDSSRVWTAVFVKDMAVSNQVETAPSGSYVKPSCNNIQPPLYDWGIRLCICYSRQLAWES